MLPNLLPSFGAVMHRIFLVAVDGGRWRLPPANTGK